MKKGTGIARLIDHSGRIIIPKILREEIGIKTDEFIEFLIDEENHEIILKKYEPKERLLCLKN